MAQNPFEQALIDEGLKGTPLESLARSIYMQESGGGQNTKTSNAGAVGGMQILPGTFNEMLPGGNINDPYQNSVAGLRYIKKMSDLAGGDPSLTAAGYYGGPGGIQKAKQGVAVSDPRNPNAPTTLEYAKQVTARQDVSRGTKPPKIIRKNIDNLGTGYQAAFALMGMADEEPENEREKAAREEREETESAQQFASIQKQLTSNKLSSPLMAQEPVERANGSPEEGEVAQDNQGSGFNIERWIAEKAGLAPAWDKSLKAPEEMGFSEDSGTRGDAIRHMTLMREIEKKYNPTVAKTIGYAHEIIGGPMQYFTAGEPQSSRDREMDLRNNALGLELSKQAGGDDEKFKQLMRQALENKQADYYREEYVKQRPMGAAGMALGKSAKGARRRAEGSPEEGEVAEPSLKQTAATMLASLKNPEHWKELGAGAKRAAQATPGVVESVARGAIATVPGTPGDIESLIRLGTGGKQVLPTTEDLLKRTDKYRLFDKPQGAEDLEMVGGFISPAGAPASAMITKGVGKAMKGTAKAALQDLDLAMTGQGGSKVAQMLTSQAQPAFAVRPKGGVFMGAQSAKDAPLSRPDFDIREALEGMDVSTDQGKAVADFLDKKVRKYIQTQQGTADDPVFKAMLQGRIQPRYLGEPEMWAAARAGDPEALTAARRRYDTNLGLVHIVPEAIAKERGKGYAYSYVNEQQKALREKIKQQSPNEDTLMADVRPVGKQQMEEYANLYDYPGVQQAVKESESGKLLRLLNKTDLPPHLRQAVIEGEPIAYQYSGMGGFASPLNLSNMKDYLNTRTPAEIKNMGVADVVAKSEEWHRVMAEARKDPSKFSKKQLMQGTENVLPASKDMNWVNVKDSDALSLEGNIMGHCVGGSNYCSAVNKGTTKIISLRDKKGFPHVTIELAANDKGVFDKVAQVKGTANNSPEKYFQQIDEFLTDYQSKLGDTPLRITERPSYVPEKWRK